MNPNNMDATTAEHGPPPHLSAGFHRTGSMESTEHLSRRPIMGGMKSTPGLYAHGYPYPQSQFAATRSPRQLQSVVTTSFSMEEDREYRGPMDHESRDASHYSRSPPQGREPPHYGRELPPVHEHHELDGDRRDSVPHDMPRSRTSRVPPSPRGAPGDHHPQHLHRSYSAGGAPPSYRSPGQMKRSFWHHARPNDEFLPSSLPNEFMPPKRAKMNPTRKEFVVTARLHPEEMPPSERRASLTSRPPANYFNRATSWEAREEYYQRKPYQGSWSRHSPPSCREGDAGPHWSDAPPMPSPHGHYSPSEGGHYDAQWNQSRGWQQPHPDDRSWGPPPQYRDEADSNQGWVDSREGHHGEVRRQSTFDSCSEIDYSYLQPAVRGMGAQRRTLYPSSHGVPDVRGGSAPHTDLKSKQTLLLALAEDRISLSETLCVVRENVEVFTATLHDVEAPAPGRKHAVVVGQVGLRCIHCRHTTRSSERVKRAVCYPSSIKRIYRTVIDMKLDHFLHCKFVPESLKETLNALKANNTRSTGTTMQYFIRTASSLGLVDGPTGVRLVENTQDVPLPLSPPMVPQKIPSYFPSNGKEGTPQVNRNNSMSFQSTLNPSAIMEDPKELFMGKIPLAVPEDKMSLSPLRCFLREQVCAFSATEEDIAVRTPTTFSVSVGQVGIGCVHCLNRPAKLRLNRAVCFPFSIARIYQSVADIQRFHLSECKMVPPDVKEKFLTLQSASSKGSKGLATRQYWVTSAKKVGLVDTTRGIRFGRDPSVPETKSIFLDILAQVASSVTTVNKPLVLPEEDKPFIADFLYSVMEQLQPCRFTEADRNKRRLKDVGCVGVECKHCAGQVDSRKFFWSSVNAVESNFVSVHIHMMECKMIPEPLKQKLAELKGLRKEQTAALKTGSQKAFFSRVWNRLHSSDDKQQKQQATAQDGTPTSETTPSAPSAASPKKEEIEAPALLSFSSAASIKEEEIEIPASLSFSISSASGTMDDESGQAMDIISV